MRICHPIPDQSLPDAARLWCARFSAGLGRRRARASHAIVALSAQGQVIGVAGLRDEAGGFLADGPKMGVMALAALLYRPAPPTGDLVIDGITAALRRRGVGRALIAKAGQIAHARGRAGLRAEVRLRNFDALAFYRALGFAEETRGRFGWPWSGVVVVLRRPLS